MTTKSLHELHAALATTTEPAEYDRLQAEIKQAEKDASLNAAQAEIDRKVKADLEHRAAKAKHDQHKVTLSTRAEAMLIMDMHIFDQLEQLHQTLAERYALLKDTNALYQVTASEAVALGEPEPVRPVDPNPWPDASSLERYGQDWIRQYTENHRYAEKAGIKLTVENIGLPTYLLHK